MGKSRYLVLGAAAAVASLAAINAAQAVTVTVWGGYDNATGTNNTTPNNPGAMNGAQDPNPTNASQAMFTWTGPINWVNNAGQNSSTSGNLYGSFFTGGTISGFSSADGTYSGASGEADFLASSMSINHDAYWTYIRVDGTTGAGTARLEHDDGASVYQGGVALYNYPSETSQNGTQMFAIGSGAYHIDYIEGNGSPSVLTFAVPELSTWAMMLAGFAGLGFAAFRRSGRAAISVA